MQGYEPKADPRLRGAFKYFLRLCALIGLGKLLLDLIWTPSSPMDFVVYWCALGLIGLWAERIAARQWPALAARYRASISQRALW